MQDEHGPRALADDEVALPVTNVGATLDVPWPIVDGGAVFDHVASGSRPARPAALVTAGQRAPKVIALASGAIDEGGDGFEPQGAQAALMAGLEPAGDLLRGPSFGEAITDEVPQPAIPFEDGFTPSAPLIGSGGVEGQRPLGQAFRRNSRDTVDWARPTALAMAPIERPAAFSAAM